MIRSIFNIAFWKDRTRPGLTDAKSCLQMLAARAADGFIFLGQGGREPMLNELARSSAPLTGAK